MVDETRVSSSPLLTLMKRHRKSWDPLTLLSLNGKQVIRLTDSYAQIFSFYSIVVHKTIKHSLGAWFGALSEYRREAISLHGTVNATVVEIWSETPSTHFQQKLMELEMIYIHRFLRANHGVCCSFCILCHAIAL